MFALISSLEDEDAVLEAARGRYHPHSLPAELASSRVLEITPSAAPVSSPAAVNGSDQSPAGKTPGKRRREVDQLRQRFAEKVHNRAYVEFQEARSKFPAWKERENIVDAVKKNQVSLK